MAHSRNPRAISGFTLLELVIVICIVAILGAVLADRLQRTAELAERSSMEQTASEINTALLLEFAENVIRNKRESISGMVNVNPVTWLAQKPSNYLGEFADAPPAGDASGNWYYDTKDHVLVYLVRRGDDFEPDSAGMKRVRYRVKPLYEETDSRVVVGMILSPVESYKWF